MSKPLYIVVRVGVYDQGIFGVYESEYVAKQACKRAKNIENDNYHGFEIREFVLGSDVEAEGTGYVRYKEKIIYKTAN